MRWAWSRSVGINAIARGDAEARATTRPLRDARS